MISTTSVNLLDPIYIIYSGGVVCQEKSRFRRLMTAWCMQIDVYLQSTLLIDGRCVSQV